MLVSIGPAVLEPTSKARNNKKGNIRESTDFFYYDSYPLFYEDRWNFMNNISCGMDGEKRIKSALTKIFFLTNDYIAIFFVNYYCQLSALHHNMEIEEIRILC